MKIFLVIFVSFFVATFAQDHDKKGMKELIGHAVDVCAVSSGISPETREKLRNKIFTDVPKAPEYIYCIFQAMGWVDENGVSNKEIQKTADLIYSENKELIDEKCANDLSGDTPEAGAFDSYKCFALHLSGNGPLISSNDNDEEGGVEKKQLP